jgi:hypothetical protein
MKEKKISPKKRVNEKIKEIKISYPKQYKANEDIDNEIIVPDQVFFGLILGMISGPLNVFPAMYAVVSFKKEIRKII